MGDYQRITYEETAQAIWVTLARPDELNLVDDNLFAELEDAFVRARFDDTRSVVVLRGSGRMFSGGGNLGADIAQAALRGDADLGMRMYRHVTAEYPVFETISACPKTTIAAVNGDAYGAGVDLIMLCDLAICVRDARLMFAPGKWGLCDSPNALRLGARVGIARAKDLLFTARRVDAEEAERAGLVTRLCERDRFDEAVAAYVEEVLTTSPDARRLMKQVANSTLPVLRADEHLESALGSDFRAGVRAFTEKRPAPWTPAASVAGHAASSIAQPDGDGQHPTSTRVSYEPRRWHLDAYRAAPPTPSYEVGAARLWRLGLLTAIEVDYAHVPQGASMGARLHGDADRFVLVVQGRALVWLEGALVDAQVGDIVHIPRGVVYDMTAASGGCWTVDLTSPPSDPGRVVVRPDRDAEAKAAFDAASVATGPNGQDRAGRLTRAPA